LLIKIEVKPAERIGSSAVRKLIRPQISQLIKLNIAQPAAFCFGS
jgi:hypothetical protein